MTFKEQLTFISRIRLPLLIAVVFVHVQVECEYTNIDWWFVKFLGEEVGRIGVPLFFAISGLLFFMGVERNSSLISQIIIGGGKLKRRISSLVVPYLLWNAIQFVFFLCIGRTEASDILRAFWNMNTDGHWFFPVNGPLWFLRDLFFTSALFILPLVVIRYIKPIIGMPLIAVCYLMFQYKGFMPGLYTALTFFTLGGYVGYYHLPWIKIAVRYKYIFALLYLIIIFADMWFYTSFNGFCYTLHSFGIIVGMLAFWGVASFMPTQYKGISMPSLAMFIFLSHSMFCILPSAISHKLFCQWTILQYVTNIVGVLFLCVMGYMVITRFLPEKLSKLLLGGR